MTREYKAFRAIMAGRSQREVADEIGVDRTTISRDMARLCKRYPGLKFALAIARTVHQAETAA